MGEAEGSGVATSHGTGSLGPLCVGGHAIRPLVSSSEFFFSDVAAFLCIAMVFLWNFFFFCSGIGEPREHDFVYLFMA